MVQHRVGKARSEIKQIIKWSTSDREDKSERIYTGQAQYCKRCYYKCMEIGVHLVRCTIYLLCIIMQTSMCAPERLPVSAGILVETVSCAIDDLCH